MKSKRILVLTAGSFLAVSLSATIHAAEAVWTGATSNNWAEASNWLSGEVPAQGDDLTFNDTTGAPLVLDSDHSIGVLKIGNEGTRTGSATTRTAEHTLTIAGGLVATGNHTEIGPILYGNIILSADQIWDVGGDRGTHDSGRGAYIREQTTSGGDDAGPGSLHLDGSLIKEGSGQLVVAATTVSGPGDFVINDGAFRLNAGNSKLLTMGGEGSIIINNNAQLWIARHSGTMQVTRNIIVNDFAGLTLGGGTTANDNLIESNLEWNGGHHVLDLPVAPRYEISGTWSAADPETTVFRTGGSTLTLSGDMRAFTGTLSLGGGTNNITGLGIFSGSLEVTGGANHLDSDVRGDVSLSGGDNTILSNHIGG